MTGSVIEQNNVGGFNKNPHATAEVTLELAGRAKKARETFGDALSRYYFNQFGRHESALLIADNENEPDPLSGVA